MREDYLGIKRAGCDRVVLHVINLFQLLNDLTGVLSLQRCHSDNLTRMMMRMLMVERT